MTETPVEVTVKYATTVQNLSAAWTFVMDHIDCVGPDPSVLINPKWRFRESENGERFFEVTISGMMENE